MMQPRILISSSPGNANYIHAIEAQGGIAVVAENDDPQDCAGLVLCGGGDVDPSFYGEEINGTEVESIKRERDEKEFSLIRKFVELQRPILGICRGHQILNVCFGGTLIQDLPNAPDHMYLSDIKADNAHPTDISPDSFLFPLYGSSVITNSTHHQAIARIGSGLRAVQWAEPGHVIEAVQHESLPIFSVQWHPERMTGSYFRNDRADGGKIFSFFFSLL